MPTGGNSAATVIHMPLRHASGPGNRAVRWGHGIAETGADALSY